VRCRSFGCNEYGLVRFLAWFGGRYRRLIYAYESELVRLPVSRCPTDLHLFCMHPDTHTLGRNMHTQILTDTHTHRSSNYCIYEIQLLLLLRQQLLHRYSPALVCAFWIQGFSSAFFFLFSYTFWGYLLCIA